LKEKVDFSADVENLPKISSFYISLDVKRVRNLSQTLNSILMMKKNIAFKQENWNFISKTKRQRYHLQNLYKEVSFYEIN